MYFESPQQKLSNLQDLKNSILIVSGKNYFDIDRINAMWEVISKVTLVLVILYLRFNLYPWCSQYYVCVWVHCKINLAVLMAKKKRTLETKLMSTVIYLQFFYYFHDIVQGDWRIAELAIKTARGILQRLTHIHMHNIVNIKDTS